MDTLAVLDVVAGVNIGSVAELDAQVITCDWAQSQ